MPSITDGRLLSLEAIAPQRVEVLNRTLSPIESVSVATTYLNSLPNDNLSCVVVLNYRAQEQVREWPVSAEGWPLRKRKAFNIEDQRSQASKTRKKVKTWQGQQEGEKVRSAGTEMTHLLNRTSSVGETRKEFNYEPAQANFADRTCSECGIVFVQRSSVAQHMRAVHKIERKFSCQHKGCTRMYKARGDLTRHVKSIYLKERPFNCHICGENFTRSHSLKRHMSNIHVRG